MMKGMIMVMMKVVMIMVMNVVADYSTLKLGIKSFSFLPDSQQIIKDYYY